MRVHIHDVLARIAQVSCGYAGLNAPGAIEDYSTQFPFCLRLCITTDVEQTELDYMSRFGPGATLYFTLVDYAHGCDLAKELFRRILGSEPDMSGYEGFKFDPSDSLYLFLHLEQTGRESMQSAVNFTWPGFASAYPQYTA